MEKLCKRNEDAAITAEVMGPFKSYDMVFVKTDSEEFYVRCYIYEQMKTRAIEVEMNAMAVEAEMEKKATAEDVVVDNTTEVEGPK